MTETAQEKNQPDLLLWTNKIPTASLQVSMIDGVLCDVALALLEVSKAMATGKISKAEVVQRMTVLQRVAVDLYLPARHGPGEAAEISRQWEIERATAMISMVKSRLEVRLDAELEVRPAPQRELDRMRESEATQRRYNEEDWLQ